MNAVCTDLFRLGLIRHFAKVGINYYLKVKVELNS